MKNKSTKGIHSLHTHW